jgi:hypothetical protein
MLLIFFAYSYRDITILQTIKNSFYANGRTTERDCKKQVF